MNKETVLQRICSDSLVAVIRASGYAEAGQLVSACVEGGIKLIEITFTVPGAHRLLASLSETYEQTDVMIGAGTVLDEATAHLALLHGARFIVSPCLNVEVVTLCNRYGILALPGIMTVREAVLALEAGADLLKVFPGELLGPKFVQALKGPLPQLRLMPTGGVDLPNIRDWFQAGSVAVGVGGNLTCGIAGDYSLIAARAQQFVQAVGQAKSEAGIIGS